MLNSYEMVNDWTRNWWPFNTGDCLIEVTSWVGFTVYTLFVLLKWDLYEDYINQVVYRGKGVVKVVFLSDFPAKTVTFRH